MLVPPNNTNRPGPATSRSAGILTEANGHAVQGVIPSRSVIGLGTEIVLSGLTVPSSPGNATVIDPSLRDASRSQADVRSKARV